MRKVILFIILFTTLSCTIEDTQDCLKIVKIESKQSGYYLTLENNVIIYNGVTSTYKVDDYYCYK